MPVEPIHRRATERKVQPHEGARLDRRLQPVETTEGQLQRAKLLIDLKNRYSLRKIIAIQKYAKSIGKELNLTELQEILENLDLVAQKLHEKRLVNARDLSLVDDKTKLRIEKGFRSYIEGYIKEQPSGTFFFIDVNNLKKINDHPNLGHRVGDLYLKTFAESMKEIAKKYNLIICRAGGDEFAMYSTTNKLTKIKINHMIEELKQNFKTKWLQKGIEYPAEFAIGYASKFDFDEIKEPHEMYDALRELADARMYQNKTKMKSSKT